MPATILLIDDERDLVSLWREYLEARGLEAHVAHGVVAARRRLRELRPDIIVLDYQLPDGVAEDVIAALEPPLPQVIVSSGRGDDLPSSLREAGHLILGKPFRLEQLDEAIATALARRGS